MPSGSFLPEFRSVALGAQNVAMTAYRMNELHRIVAIDLAPQPGNVNFNYVAEFLPVVVVEVLQQFALGNHRARPMRQVLQNAIFHGHERDLFLPAADGALNGIQLKIGDGKNRGSLAFPAPYQSLGSRQEF